MLDAKTIDAIANEIIRQMGQGSAPAPSGQKPSAQRDGPVPAQPPARSEARPETGEMEDITSAAQKAVPTLQAPADYDALIRMKGRTSARIGVGRCGPRLLTKTLLTLRADHALARDAVFTDVDPEFLRRNNLFSVQTKCPDKNTRPDLGRQLSDEAVQIIREKCQKNPDVQIVVSDGLSSKAIEANVQNALPAIVEGLQSRGITVGTPFFIRFGRRFFTISRLNGRLAFTWFIIIIRFGRRRLHPQTPQLQSCPAALKLLNLANQNRITKIQRASLANR